MGCIDDDKERQEQDRVIQRNLQKIKYTLLIMSGKGGVGKSTVAVNLAVSLAQKKFKVGLMDVDLHGPSVPGMLGLTKKPLMHMDNIMLPLQFSGGLKVFSIQNMLSDSDNAIIWRGPLKIAAIRQFFSDVQWGELDFLVIDSPPGTGDEPLTLAQMIAGAYAIIVTTPQEVALADVRKCINFAGQLSLRILGVVENMSGFVCPHCMKETDIFLKGGGELLAARTGLRFLGRIPLDPCVAAWADEGRLFTDQGSKSPAAGAIGQLVTSIVCALGPHMKETTESNRAPASLPLITESVDNKEENNLTIAIPLTEGLLCSHFGHCEQFALATVKDGMITGREHLTPPPHEPGLLPRWLSEKGANVVIAGGMGSHAMELFEEFGIKVIAGAPSIAADELVMHYLGGTLATGVNVCDH